MLWTPNLKGIRMTLAEVSRRRCGTTHTHTRTDEKRVCVHNEADLTFPSSGCGVYFSALFLPQFPLTTTPCVLTDQRRETETERSGEENGEVKKEGATHRPHNGCGISYTANTEAETSVWFGLPAANCPSLTSDNM